LLRLFHSIFGTHKADQRYPDTLVNMAIERTVDSTDPWLRGLSGYRRKLRPAVVHAIDHVVAMVDNLGEVLELSSKSYDAEPELRLFFISTAQMNSLLKADPMLSAFRREAGHTAVPTWALLVMSCEQRQTFGVALQGATIVRDVSQITVSMSDHRLLDPTADLAETRRLLKRRAFDHLLTLALAEITAAQHVREDLAQHRSLLQAKLDFLQRGGWGFESPDQDVPPPEADLQRQLEVIDSQFSELGGDDLYLEKHLEILVDVLANAEHQLWAQPVPLIVDRMGIKHSMAAEDAPELTLTELHNKAGLRLIARLVMMPA
jgi:hypothetical protein